jgi:hypothetical protein
MSKSLIRSSSSVRGKDSSRSKWRTKRGKNSFRPCVVFVAVFPTLIVSSQLSSAGLMPSQIIKEKATGLPKPNPINNNPTPAKTPGCLSIPVPDGVRLNVSCLPFISNIQKLLETCPASDPATATILANFEIRRNGKPVTLIQCAPPVSALPLSKYSDELILIQTLRVMYYMDRGKSGHLPWAKGTMYDWMKAKVRGINIDDKETAAARCCGQIDGKLFISLASLKNDDFNRARRREWLGLSGLLGLLAHERRHADDIAHVSCKGSDNMDQTYDEKNLSCFGVQWWLTRAWLTGTIPLGLSCLAKDKTQEIADWHMIECKDWRDNRFCTALPPLLMKPSTVGGMCYDVPSTSASPGPAASGNLGPTDEQVRIAGFLNARGCNRSIGRPGEFACNNETGFNACTMLRSRGKVQTCRLEKQ